MGEKVLEELKLKAIEIISECNKSLLNENSENFNVIRVILNEFESILKSIKTTCTVNVLNKKRDLWSSRTIIDSANFDYDKHLFSMVEEFSKLCRKLNSKYVKTKFD